jgi:hypothetical protein
MILVAAAFGGFWWLMQRRTTESEWRVLPMTSLPSLEQQPAFAPLADQVAFTWDGGGWAITISTCNSAVARRQGATPTLIVCGVD